MSGVSDVNKKIARHIASKFGGSPKVTRYWSDDQAISVDLLAAAGSPCSGVMSYGTIGLSDHPVRINDDGDEVCVELLGACADAVKNFPNALTTAAFYTIRNQWHCVHGGVLQNALDMYKLSVTMKHFLFTSPFCGRDSTEWTSVIRKFTGFWRCRSQMLSMPICGTMVLMRWNALLKTARSISSISIGIRCFERLVTGA